MKLTTTRKVVLLRDREGIVEEHVRININVAEKDDVNKIYKIKTFDSMVFNKGTEAESTTPVLNRYGQPQQKEYVKTYAEYDAQKAQLLQAFPSDLLGSELDDYLLLQGLKVNLMNDPVYVDGNEWE